MIQSVPRASAELNDDAKLELTRQRFEEVCQ